MRLTVVAVEAPPNPGDFALRGAEAGEVATKALGSLLQVIDQHKREAAEAQGYRI